MLIAQLLLADLVEGLAIDTERGGGTCLEPADANLDAAALALAVFAGVEPREGLVDLLDELALAVSRAEFERDIGFLRGAVVGVGKVRGLVLHVMHGAVDFLHQLAFPGVQDGAKVLDLLFIHVLLALLDGIGLEVLEGGEQRLRAGARGSGGLFRRSGWLGGFARPAATGLAAGRRLGHDLLGGGLRGHSLLHPLGRGGFGAGFHSRGHRDSPARIKLVSIPKPSGGRKECLCSAQRRGVVARRNVSGTTQWAGAGNVLAFWPFRSIYGCVHEYAVAGIDLRRGRYAGRHRIARSSRRLQSRLRAGGSRLGVVRGALWKIAQGDGRQRAHTPVSR